MRVSKKLWYLWSQLKAPFSSQAMGLEIGSQQVKIVVLKKNKTTISAPLVLHAPLPLGAVVGHCIKEPSVVGQCIKSLLAPHVISTQNIILGLPGSLVIEERVVLNEVLLQEDEATFEEWLRLEMEKHIPNPMTEMALDYQVLGAHAKDPKRIEVLVVVAKAQVLNTYISTLHYADLKANVIDVEHYALAHVYPYLDLSHFPNKPTLCLAFFACNDEYATLTVIEGVNMLYKGEQRIDIAHPTTQLIGEWLTRALSLFYASGVSKELDGVLLTGGHYPKVPDLLSQLQSHVEHPVAWANPFEQIQLTKPFADLHNYVLSTSLALRGLG